MKSIFKKLNIETSISSRDKKLLYVACAVLMVFLSYYFAFNKMEAKNIKSETKISTLERQVRDLDEKNRHKQTYIDDTKDYNEETEKIISNYANGSSIVSELNFLSNAEGTNGIWIRSASFQTPVANYTFGGIAPSNPSGYTSYTTDMRGFKLSQTISYEGDYNQWKALINYINSYFSKNTIESISASFDESSNTVSGTMVLNMYYITSEDRKFVEPDFNIATGKANIFSSNETNNSVVEVKVSE